jgi:peptidyl-prolyl cis-trans isomerase A (cyclophilin A)
MKFSIILILSAAGLAHGQIHADFAVSRGGVPLGTFRARLDHQKAPRTCANFIGLASGARPWIDLATGSVKVNRPFYNGLTFHRLIHNFVIQGGSPNGLGTDGPGYVIQDEFHADLRHSGRYMLSMAKSALPGSGGSQFFITLAAAPNLNDKHSVFGEVIDGKELIDSFADPVLFPTTNDRPQTPITMDSVVISGPDLAAFDLDDPALMLPAIGTTALVPSRNSAANQFTVTFDRGFQTEHLIHYSTDLINWAYFRHIRSREAAAGYRYTLSNVTFPKFFMRSARVDYGLVPNPSLDLFSAGKEFALSDRAGNTLTLIPNGAGGGTWRHSNGGSGTLTSLTTSDYVPATGVNFEFSGGGQLFPLLNLSAGFNTPAGPAAWNSLNLILSFHAPRSGWVDGSANTNLPVLQSFSVTP